MRLLTSGFAWALSLFVAATTFAQAQDYEKAKAEFKTAVAAMHETNTKDAADRLAKSDNKEAADVLLDGYGSCAGQLKQLWAEKVRWIREMDANSDIEWETTPQGSRPTSGSVNKFLKLTEAQKKGKEVEDKIMRVEAVKRAIVAALATFKGDSVVKELIAKLKSDQNWDRRAGIAEALGPIQHADALPALLEQLRKDAEAGVKVACIDALKAKKANTPEVIALLCEQLKNEFWQVKYTAAIALKELGSKDAIEPLIEALKGTEGRLKHEFNDVLVALSGVDKHGDYSAWRTWWDKNRDGVKAGGYKPAPEDAPGGIAAAEHQTTTFYGIPVKSKNVIFILDCSASMLWDSEWKPPAGEDNPTATGSGGSAPGPDKYGKPDGNRKIDIARWQLKRCLAQLADGTEFNLIFFNTTFKIMSEKMVKMTDGTRKMALGFVEKLVPEGGTNIFDPMEKAFSLASTGELKDKLAKSGADTIFLLTDGMPNSGQVPDATGILGKLREMNRVKKIVINTIGVFSTNPPVPVQANEKDEGEKFLAQMAQEHGGVFVNASGTTKKDGGGAAGGGGKKK